MTGTDWALVGNVGALLGVVKVGWSIVRVLSRLELQVETLWKAYVDTQDRRRATDG